MKKRLWWADDPKESKLLVDRNGLLDDLEAGTPPVSGRREAFERMIAGAEVAGLPVSAPRGGRTIYHLDFSWNCLFYALPELQKAYRSSFDSLRALTGLTESERHGSCCPEGGQEQAPARVLRRPRSLRWTVELRVDSIEPYADSFIRANIPRPSHISSQSNVRLLGAWTHGKELELKRMKRYLRMTGVPARELADGQGRLQLRFEFALDKSEVHAHGFKVPHVAPPLLALPIEKFLDAVRSQAPSAWSRAYHLYRWMLSNSRYLRGKVGCACLKCAPQKFLFRAGGNCYLMTRAFNAFGRQLGLRTRVAFGSLPTQIDPLNPRGQVIPIRGNSVFSHFWSELEVPGVGWLPIDFLPGSFVGRGEAPEDRYLRKFYAGSSDSLRVQVSPRLKRVPLLEHATAPGPKADWKPIPARLVQGTAKIAPLEAG